MGHFLAVTAFRIDSVADVARAITEDVASCSVSCESIPVASPVDLSRDAQIHAPVDGWTVVLWPEYFNLYDFTLVRRLAIARPWLVSTVHVYDDEYWEHLSCSRGVELHAFSSRPRFWERESPDDFRRMNAYDAEPSRLASALQILPQSIRPYLVDVDALTAPGVKAHPDDEFALDDFWVFTDFWRRLSITYPTPGQNSAAVLRLGRKFKTKLPVG
jgi:hypothetical protein